MNMPKVNIRRTLLIAWRDFMGYVKTWGFWLTALAPFIAFAAGLLVSMFLISSEPTRYVTILDETGVHGTAIQNMMAAEEEELVRDALQDISRLTVTRDNKEEFETILETQGTEAAKAYIRKTNPRLANIVNMSTSGLQFVEPPSLVLNDLKAYLLEEKKLDIDGMKQKLDGLLHIYNKDGELQAELWSTSPIDNDMSRMANRYFRTQARNAYLRQGGLSLQGYRQASNESLRVSRYNPAKSTAGEEGQKMTVKDRAPYGMAAGLSIMLWFAIFAGAQMLLVSMIEEKISKALEMLLATTRFSEIFIGKLLGVAALTAASLLPWAIMGGFAIYGIMQFGDATLADNLAIVISQKMLIFLPVFLVLGYLFYGSIFIALGALAESMQDASTLITPMILLLAACFMVVPMGISFPDAPLVRIAQFIPFSAPFASIIRLPSNPPLWETIVSACILAFSAMLIIWLSSRVFRHGILSGGGMAIIKDWFYRTILRRKT